MCTSLLCSPCVMPPLLGGGARLSAAKISFVFGLRVWVASVFTLSV
jgi:hypothetical protein